MATNLNNQLLSIKASGAIGKAFVISSFKGCSYIKKYVKKTISQSPAAILARTEFKIAAYCWSNFINLPIVRNAWNLFEGLLETPMTPYNAFVSQAVKLQKINPNGAFLKTMSWEGTEATLSFVDVKFGLPATETGQFEIWVRVKEGCWTLKEKQTMIDGKLNVDLSDELRYNSSLKIIKDKLNRSGSIMIRR